MDLRRGRGCRRPWPPRVARRKALCALFPGQAGPLPLPGSLSPFRAVSGEGPVGEKKAGRELPLEAAEQQADPVFS